MTDCVYCHAGVKLLHGNMWSMPCAEMAKILCDRARTQQQMKLQLLVCVPGCFRVVPRETHKIKEYFREAYSARIEPANQSSNQPRVKVIGQRRGKGVGGAVKPNFTDHGVCRWWRAVQRQKGIKERERVFEGQGLMSCLRGCAPQNPRSP